MSKKKDRLSIIKKLIETERISSQEELLALLNRIEINATQSTLSRDIKELRAVKAPDAEKGYVYLLPETLHGDKNTVKNESPVTDNIRYIDFSGNTIVMKTKQGYAKAVGVMIDGEDYEDVVGTLAGDDTLFILLAEDVKPVNFLTKFDSIHPNIKNLYSPENRNSHRKKKSS